MFKNFVFFLVHQALSSTVLVPFPIFSTLLIQPDHMLWKNFVEVSLPMLVSISNPWASGSALLRSLRSLDSLDLRLLGSFDLRLLRSVLLRFVLLLCSSATP